MPLNEDRIRALEGRTGIPPVTVPNSKLGAIGQDAEGFDVVAWIPDPDPQILDGNGDPNGNIVAPKGTLYVDKDGPNLWQNSDGNDVWTQGFAGSGFPVDDGTATFDQQHLSVAGNSQMLTTVTDDATGASSQIIQSTSSSGGASTVIRADDGLGNLTSIGLNALGQIFFSSAGVTLDIQLGSSSDAVGFFSATPVVQQTATTLPQVIAALQAYGLLA